MHKLSLIILSIIAIGEAALYKAKFPLEDFETNILDEVNGLRSAIATGSVRNILDYIFVVDPDDVRSLVQKSFVGSTKIFEDVMNGIPGDSEGQMREMREELKATEMYYDQRVKLLKMASNLTDDLEFASSIDIPVVGDVSVPEVRDVLAPVLNELNLKVPKNVFGPAANMNLLTWNRRLAQLAAVKSNEFKNGLREVEYDGQKYRMFAKGSLWTTLIKEAARVIEKEIRKMLPIPPIFDKANLGILVMNLIMSEKEAPFDNEDYVKDQLVEAIFADRKELGCYQTTPDSICIIGPIITRTGYFYESGPVCSKCKTSCASGLCRPSLNYKSREKYEKYLKKRMDRFNEFVEEED